MVRLYVDSIRDASLHLQSFGFEHKLPGKRLSFTNESYRIRYILGGKGRFNHIPVARGSCCLSVPGEQYTIESSSDDPLVYYWFDVSGKSVPIYIEQMFQTNRAAVVPFSNAETVESILYDFLFSSNTNRDIPIYAHSVFYHLFSIHMRNKSTAAIPRTLIIYRRAVEYIEEHCHERIKVADICAYLHIVPDYLYKIFCRYSGSSTQEYILQTKMQVAKLLLDDPGLSIIEISELVGYSDHSLFSRNFRRVYGCSPSTYRQSRNEGAVK